ncbi:MAG: anthranilate phosphoribosyltransferase [Polyangiaceae bacterium]
MSEGGSTSSFASVLDALATGDAPTKALVRGAFEAILSGAWTPMQVGAFAAALRVRGEGADAIVAGAQALRDAMEAVDHGLDAVLDTCGTGGDGGQTLNLSTAAAIVVAACGVAVAKHGNRSVSSRCGSADVVEALGIAVDVAPNDQAGILREAGIVFLFAPAHHPALRHAAVARRELGVRTIFNALGPLANPARATHQLVGVYSDALRPIAARALASLGTRRAWVVRSTDGLDEVSPCAPTRVSEAFGGEVRERTITSEDFGLRAGDRGAIAGGTAHENAETIVRILEGEAHAARDAVLLNAAAALAVADAESTLLACAERARDAIASGAARERLERWRTATAKRALAHGDQKGGT